MFLGMEALLARRRLPALGASLVAAAWACKPAGAQPVLEPPEMKAIDPPTAAPAAQFTGLDGVPHSLAAYRGRPVVLNFWATWCTPCVAELPELDRLAASAPDLAILVVSADHGGAATVRGFLASHPISHATVLLDPESEAVHLFDVFGFPTTLVIDAAGRLRARLEGPASWSGAAAMVRGMTK